MVSLEIHNTEIALVKTWIDLTLSLPGWKIIFLELVDLSAAFNAIGHKLFITQRENTVWESCHIRHCISMDASVYEGQCKCV